MAFKTDQIKLKDNADNTAAGTPDDGTLALIGASGSRELKIRDGGAWVAISGGGGSLSNVVEDTTPELGGDLVTDGNKIAHATGGGSSELTFTHTWNAETNHTHLASVKSIDLYLDMNGGDAGQALRVYNNLNPNIHAPDDTNYIWKLAENGTMYMTNGIDMGTNVITDAKVAEWDTAYSMRLSLGTSAGEALEGNTPTITAAQTAKLGHISVTQAVDLDVIEGWGDHSVAGYLTDGDFSSAGLMTTNGSGGYSITPTNTFSTVDELNDLSDVATPATLDATHVGKAVGVVSGGGTASVLTLDHTGIVDNFVTQNIYFDVGGQEYWIAYDGSNPVTSETSFTLQGSGIKRAIIDGTNVTNDGMGSDIRTLMAVFQNGTESSGYTITGSGPSMTMTANATGVASNIDYPSLTASNLESGMSVTQVEGLDPQYQYELINTSGAADPNWNHVQNSAWGGDLTIAASTASNLTWVNTQDPSTNELTIRQPSDYGAYAVITVMNASTHTMDISTVDNTFDFNCQQLNPTQVNTITLQSFQKAIVVRTGGTDWDVVIASI